MVGAVNNDALAVEAALGIQRLGMTDRYDLIPAAVYDLQRNLHTPCIKTIAGRIGEKLRLEPLQILWRNIVLNDRQVAGGRPQGQGLETPALRKQQPHKTSQGTAHQATGPAKLLLPVGEADNRFEFLQAAAHRGIGYVAGARAAAAEIKTQGRNAASAQQAGKTGEFFRIHAAEKAVAEYDPGRPHAIRGPVYGTGKCAVPQAELK